ncbi:MAG: NYN domain-containing protein [Candidatus Diapherotrites archaeon]
MFLKKKRVVVFIDGSNLYHDLLNNFGKANIDFSAFVDFLVEKNKLIKTYYYNVPVNQKEKPEEYKKQQKFFSALQKIPRFEVKLGRLEKRPKGPPVEKGVDVRMAVDIVTHAYSNIYDTAIIVSGDADFAPAIKAAQDFGKEVINVCFPKTKSFHLNQICNKTIVVDEEKIAKLLWKKQ